MSVEHHESDTDTFADPEDFLTAWQRAGDLDDDDDRSYPFASLSDAREEASAD